MTSITLHLISRECLRIHSGLLLTAIVIKIIIAATAALVTDGQYLFL